MIRAKGLKVLTRIKGQKVPGLRLGIDGIARTGNDRHCWYQAERASTHLISNTEFQRLIRIQVLRKLGQIQCKLPPVFA